MDDHASLVRRGAARFLSGLLVALGLAVPLLGGPGERPEERNAAEKVAKNLEQAVGTAHRAEEAREALRDFQKELAKYAVLHARELARLGPHVRAAAQDSVAAQKALARAIAANRPTARPGDIFQPEIQPLFRRLIAEQLKGPDALDARKAVREGNPKHEPGAIQVVVRVNAEYALGAPLSTVPASLLLSLPPLPAPLQYRFVGSDLILLDSVAGLIVDVLPAAAPDLATR